MKKLLLIFLLTLSLLNAQDLSLTNFRWRSDESAMHKFHFAYNAGFNIPMHAYAEKRFHINDHVDMAFGVVISSENDVGATHVRPDFPLFSTGRFYRGEVLINYKNLKVNLGRNLQDINPIRQKGIWNKSRLTGEGIRWSWDFLENWRFENSIEFISNEKNPQGQIFERILNYHAFTWKNDKLAFSIGEISLYSGVDKAFNWSRSNPFLPYIIHMVDSYDTRIPAYSGDNENIIFTFNAAWNITKKLSLQSKIYIDDIQIDAADREHIADMFLCFNELYYQHNEYFRTSLQFSFANPAMGWHEGPFTSLNTYGYELLPHHFGEIYSSSINLNFHKKFFEAYIKAYILHKAIIDPAIEKLYLHKVQGDLEKESILGLDIKTGFYIFKNLALWGHVRLETNESPVYNLILQTYF